MYTIKNVYYEHHLFPKNYFFMVFMYTTILFYITIIKVPGACFSLVDPTPVENPTLVCAAFPALKLIDITEDDVNTPEFVEYFGGNKILPGSQTAAHCYCGHQFGYFSGQLGDGAAM